MGCTQSKSGGNKVKGKLPSGPAKVPPTVVPKYPSNLPPATNPPVKPQATNPGASMGLWTSNSNANPSVPPPVVEHQPLLTSNADPGLVSSLPGVVAPIHIPVTSSAGSGVVQANNQPRQLFGSNSQPIDPYKPSTIYGGPVGSYLKPNDFQPTQLPPAHPPSLIKPPEATNLPQATQPLFNLPIAPKPNEQANPSGLNSSLFEVAPSLPPPSESISGVKKQQNSSLNIQEDQRVDRPLGSYTDGIMVGGSIKSNPAAEDLSWATNICSEEYSDRQVELINIPKIRVQIA